MLKSLAKSMLGDALFAGESAGSVSPQQPPVENVVAQLPAKPARRKLPPIMIGADGVGTKEQGGQLKRTATLPFPVHLENRHMLIGGTTGAGKTRLFFQIADQARDRGDKALLVDHGSEQIMRNWRPGDIILNPYDDRFPGWTPFSEVDAPWDAQNLARYLIPEGIGNNQEWNVYAQQLLGAVIGKIIEDVDATGISCETNDEIVSKAVVASLDDLLNFLAGDPITGLLAKDNAKMVGSVRGIVSTKLAPFRYLNDGEFSLRDWATDDNDRRWVFICYRDEMFGSLRSLISCWVSLTIMYLLSLDENEDRKFWLFLDELGSLDQIPALTEALAKSRKRGGIVVAGLQTVSQFTEKYGEAGATSLMANFGTWITLRAGDAETAEAFSKHYGEQEVWQDSINEGMNIGGGDSGASMNDGVNLQLKKQRVIEYTELMSLPDLAGFIKIPGPYPASEITAAIVPPPTDRGTVAFIPATKGKAAYKSRRAAKRAEKENKASQEAPAE